MRTLLAILALLLVAPAAQARPTLPDIEDEVMCVSCGTVLNVSQAPSADQTRDFIRRRIAEGLTKQQIKDRLVDEFGPNVLPLPPTSSSNVAAWGIPVGLAVLALAAVGLTVRRWKRVGADPPDADDLDDEDSERLERDMAGYDL